MKIIDEKGRLFGKINIIDLLIILLAAAVLALLCIRFIGGRTPGSRAERPDEITADQQISIRYKVLLEDIDQAFLDGLERHAVGASLVADDYVVNGSITDMQTMKRDDGNSDRCSVLLTCEYSGKMNANCLMQGQQAIRVGLKYIVRTTMIEIEGCIADVEILK